MSGTRTPCNLGDFIALLRASPPGNRLVIAGPLHLVPNDVDSYRGYYEDLAISFFVPPESYGLQTLTRAFLDTLESAIDKTFTGYKGGDYRMDADSNLWVSNYGACTHAAVLGVEIQRYSGTTYILTKMIS